MDLARDVDAPIADNIFNTLSMIVEVGSLFVRIIGDPARSHAWKQYIY